MEEGVSDRKDDKNEKIDEGKEAEFPDDTIPVYMEKDVSEIKDDKNEKIDEKKMQNSRMKLLLVIWRKV